MARDCYTGVSQETVERYCLGHLDSEEVERFEEHLLVCPDCQDRVAASDQYINAMKSALREPSPKESPRKRWSPFRWSPVLAASFGAATLAVFLFYLPRGGGSGAPELVTLRAERGFDDPVTAAPSGRPLLFKADLSQLPELPAYRLEIVDSEGAAVWQGEGAPAGPTLTIAAPGRLRPGRYWIRISGDGRLLREFGLKVN